MIQKHLKKTEICWYLRVFSLGLAFLVLGGCGYAFQGSRNPALIKDGIQKIYVLPIENKTFKPGVENTVYNSLIRTIIAHRRVTLVSRQEDADALLSGAVSIANYGSSAGLQVSGLRPVGLGGTLSTQAGYVVASEYTAYLGCTFDLVRRAPKANEKRYLWGAGMSRSRPFPSANQLDVPGTTSPLINESEFERALLDLSRSMMDDVHDAMLARF